MRTITSQSPFEWNFAKDVIQRVPGLNPNQITPQQQFVGNDGVERHMDFAIQIGELKIAIEIEGWDKTGENRGKNKQEHDEFNRRIQSLAAIGWTVLPITNAQFMESPTTYVRQIEKMIMDEEEKTFRPKPETEVAPRSLIPGPSKKLLSVVAVVILIVIAVILVLTRGSDVPANPGNSKDCSDFANYSEAKTWFDKYDPQYGDVAKLDSNGDKTPCEDLPGAPKP